MDWEDFIEGYPYSRDEFLIKGTRSRFDYTKKLWADATKRALEKLDQQEAKKSWWQKLKSYLSKVG